MSGLQFVRHNDDDAVRFELAGKLGGADVEAVHQAWQSVALAEGMKPVTADISYVTEADQHGRALLAVMDRFGTRIIADSPESLAIVQPIIGELAQPAVSRPSWFRRLMSFLLEDRSTGSTFPARAELILASAHHVFQTMLITVLIAGASVAGFAQTGSDPLSYALATPRPINPAASSTNPSAAATQSLNPYLGSVPGGKLVEGEIKLTLADAIGRGLSFNLGLIESRQADAGVRAERARAFAALLPQITARAQQSFEQVSTAELGIKLPPLTGLRLPSTLGGFGYSESRIELQYPVFDATLRAQYQARKAAEAASAMSTKDSRDVVVYAVGTAYFQVVASQARLATAKAALASAQQFASQVADQYKAEVSPEIDSLRASVQLRAAQQRLTDAENDLEKDKLTLDRITGMPLEQQWSAAREYSFSPLPEQNSPQNRFDLKSAQQYVAAAEQQVKAARDQRLPSASLAASYGSGGINPGNYNQVYSVGVGVAVPLFTGGRIRADVRDAEAKLAQREAEYHDLEGRIAYDFRVARLDAQASETAVKVAQGNRDLAQRAFEQSEDRYRNGVTNYLEVLQATEAVVTAEENYISSLFSYNVAKISLARALGSAETRLASFFGE
jgi:outer membrane protein TolC